MIKPLFVVISEFENRKTGLFMRERLLAKCLARLRNLVHEYKHIPSIASHSQLLCTMTFLRLSEQNYQLSLMAEALTPHSKVNRPADTGLVDETPLFLDEVFAELKSERAVAEAEVLDSEMFPEEEEEELEEDNEFEVQSISLDEQDHEHVIQAVDEQANVVTVQDETTGIYQIGCNEINDFANRSLWDQEKNALCKRQWTEWLATLNLDQRLRDAMDLPPPSFGMLPPYHPVGRSSENMPLLLFLYRPQKQKMKGPLNSGLRHRGAWSKIQKRSDRGTNSDENGGFDHRKGNLKKSKQSHFFHIQITGINLRPT
jgi:hypothetical protein